MKQLRKSLFSSIQQNIIDIENFTYLEPQTLIKMGIQKNSIELFNSVRDRLKYCKYEYMIDYENLVKYVWKSHLNQYINQKQYYPAFANQFSDNIINSHMIWIAFVISDKKDFNINLKNLEALWYKNSYFMDLKQAYSILSFYDKFNQSAYQRTIFQLLKVIHKDHKNYTELYQIYHSLQIIQNQYSNLSGDQMFLEIQNNIQQNIDEVLKHQDLISNINFFLYYPIDELKFIIEALKKQDCLLTPQQMKNLFIIIQNCLLNNKNYDKQDLEKILNKVNELFSQNNTQSIKYQYFILKTLQNQNNIAKYDAFPNLEQINDLNFTLKTRQLLDKENEFSNSLKNLIYKCTTINLQKNKLQCIDFDHISEIINEYQNKEEYETLLQPFRQFLGVYSFLF